MISLYCKSAFMPYSCGIVVYRLFTSIDIRSTCSHGGIVVLLSILMRACEFFWCDGARGTMVLKWSMYFEIFFVAPLMPATTGLTVTGLLCQIYLCILWSIILLCSLLYLLQVMVLGHGLILSMLYHLKGDCCRLLHICLCLL